MDETVNPKYWNRHAVIAAYRVLDPSVMPAVGAPQPGGVSYPDTIDLIQGLCRKGTLLGLDIVEITPSVDVNEITSITAGHIILNAIGAAVRAGRHR
jgi:agmatinase